MFVNSIRTEMLQQLNYNVKHATSPIEAAKKENVGYAPITASWYGTDKTNAGIGLYGVFIPTFGRESNNPVDMDPMEADTQSGFKLSQLKEPLTCPDSGKPIMTKPIFAAIKQELDEADEKTYLSVIESHKKFMYPQEEKILKFLQTQQAKHPDRTISQIVRGERQKRLGELEKKQYKVLDEIGQFAESLPDEDRTKISGLLTTSSNVIFERQENFAFQRSKFIDLIDELEMKDAAAKEKLHNIAEKLPSSKNDETAWYVKYGGLNRDKEHRSSREISEKLVSPSYTNTDHIHPWDLGGLDSVSNFWLMRARSNIVKSNKPFPVWLKEDPKRVGYIKQYLTDAQTAIDATDDKQFHPKYDNYAAKIAITIYDETKGELDLRQMFPMPEKDKATA